jgi:hypothetical protein
MVHLLPITKFTVTKDYLNNVVIKICVTFLTGVEAYQTVKMHFVSFLDSYANISHRLIQATLAHAVAFTIGWTSVS